jgi:hypothetical protein
MLFSGTPQDLEKIEEETRRGRDSIKLLGEEESNLKAHCQRKGWKKIAKNLVSFLKLTSGSERVSYVCKND